MRLPFGGNLTPGEARVTVCRMNGLSHKETATEMHVSAEAVKKYWQSIYYKLGMAKADVVIAINKLIDLGALHRMHLLMMALVLGAVMQNSDLDMRRTRAPRTTYRTARTYNVGGRV
ncbi:helix-turn-helix transcriptional regulator [Pontibacter sp. JAM-7]|uniref:helix-turn-helix transcriptional regulator n=1 Tax=Pontibacter sp. JAM-7 TaxID=3366581 RepID=UPI003AF77D29